MLSDGRVDEGFDSLVVRLTVEGGTRVVQGWGDMSPLGAMYDPAFADGARAAVRLLTEVPLGISVDPTVFDPPIIDEGE